MHNWYNDNLFNTPLARISQKISPGEKSRKVIYLATEGLLLSSQKQVESPTKATGWCPAKTTRQATGVAKMKDKKKEITK